MAGKCADTLSSSFSPRKEETLSNELEDVKMSQNY